MKTVRVSKGFAQASTLPSALQIGDDATITLQGIKLAAQVLAVKFMAGKVLYHLAVFTGSREPELANKYGMINTIGWDENGREYIRLDNIESVLVEPLAALGPKTLII